MLRLRNIALCFGIMTSLGLISCSDNSSDRFMAPGTEYSGGEQGSGDAIVGGGGNGNQNGNGNAPDEPQAPNDGSILLVTYQDVVKPAIDNACVGCHSDGGVASQLLLQNYDQVVGAIQPSLNRLGNDANPMPPNGNAQARADLAQILRAWQSQGFPEQAP
jgi:mono/diheme cytochrome c family protein